MKGEHVKTKFITALEETPFISYAVKKSGVARSTIYRWMKSNYLFRREVDKAMLLGRVHLVDFAEMALVNKIKEGHLGAIIFYLRHNDERYIDKRPAYISPQKRNLREGEVCEFCEQQKGPEFTSYDDMIKRLERGRRDLEELNEQYKEAGFDLNASLKSKGIVRLPGRDRPANAPPWVK